MTRAVRVWAAISPFERDLIEGALTRSEPGGMLVAALHADLDDHHRLEAALTAPSYDGFRTTSEPGGCEGCGEERDTALTARIDDDGHLLLLGPRCWKERSLRDTAGDQLEAFRIPTEEAP